jgi:predicted DNA-binding transcriptional regulator AlpA
MRLMIENEEYVTLDEVEKLVNMKQTSIYTRVRFGSFPQPLKFPTRMAWKSKEIEAYIDSTRKNLKEDGNLKEKGKE